MQCRGAQEEESQSLVGGELTFYWHDISMAEQMMFHKHKTVTRNSRAMNKTENEKDLPFEFFFCFPQINCIHQHSGYQEVVRVMDRNLHNIHLSAHVNLYLWGHKLNTKAQDRQEKYSKCSILVNAAIAQA